MRNRCLAWLVAALLAVAGPVAVAGTADAESGTTGGTFPTAISWAMSTNRAVYRQPLVVEYLVQANISILNPPWIPIPPDDTHKVVLQRQAAGTTRWRAVTTTAKTVMVTNKETGKDEPHYLLVDFAAESNSSYRLVYHSPDKGIDSSTSTTKSLKVSRQMHDKGVNRSGRLYILGNVDPGWSHGVVSFQRRSCTTCAWHRYDRVRTGSRGQYKVRIKVPKRGSWQYRGYVRATTGYVRSFTHVFTVKAP